MAQAEQYVLRHKRRRLAIEVRSSRLLASIFGHLHCMVMHEVMLPLSFFTVTVMQFLTESLGRTACQMIKANLGLEKWFAITAW